MLTRMHPTRERDLTTKTSVTITLFLKFEVPLFFPYRSKELNSAEGEFQAETMSNKIAIQNKTLNRRGSERVKLLIETVLILPFLH